MLKMGRVILENIWNAIIWELIDTSNILHAIKCVISSYTL